MRSAKNFLFMGKSAVIAKILFLFSLYSNNMFRGFFNSKIIFFNKKSIIKNVNLFNLLYKSK